MKFAKIFAFLLFLCAPVFAGSPITDVQFQFDRADQIYKVGDKAQVTMTVTAEDGQPADSGMLYVRVTNDGRDTLDWQEFNLAEANPVTITASPDFPSHLLIKVTARNDANKEDVNRIAGLSFSPDQITAALPKPDDFDEFWAKGRADVRALPLLPEIEPIEKECTATREVWRVRFATIGGEFVYGFLSKPVGDGPFPGIVNVPGAGPGVGPDRNMADEGFAVLVMNVFPYPVPLDEKEKNDVHNAFNEKLGTRYPYWHAADRETYFYRPMYLGIDRAIDWFAGQPFVDANRIGFVGTSQGGASALILTGLNKHIKAAVASVPAICDHGGFLKGRSPGWPLLIDHCAENERDAVVEASRYLDAVNFARSIDVPIRVTVGLIDTTCSASSVWAAYNVIPSADKEILCEPKLGHQNGEEYQKAFKWLKETVKSL